MYEYEYVFYVCMADTVPLKGKCHKKKVSKVLSMDSFTKIYIDLKKL